MYEQEVTADHNPRRQVSVTCCGMCLTGVGKTTAVRDICRVLADDCHRSVVIVDTSNEIGGGGDVPHEGIGGARRMQVMRVCLLNQHHSSPQDHDACAAGHHP